MSSVVKCRPAVIELNGAILLDGKREITFHKLVPVAISVTRMRERGVYDKGKEKENGELIRMSAPVPRPLRGPRVCLADHQRGCPSRTKYPPRAPDRLVDMSI